MLIKIRETLNQAVPKYINLETGSVLSLSVKNTARYVTLPVKNQIISNTFYTPPLPPSGSVPVEIKMYYTYPDITNLYINTVNPYYGFNEGTGEIAFIWPEFTDPSNPNLENESNETFLFYTEAGEIYAPITKQVRQTKPPVNIVGGTDGNGNPILFPYNIKDWRNPEIVKGVNYASQDDTLNLLPLYQNGIVIAEGGNGGIVGFADIPGSPNSNINCLIQFRDQFYTELLERPAATSFEYNSYYGRSFTTYTGSPCYKQPPSHRPYADIRVEYLDEESNNNYLVFLLDATGSYDPFAFEYPEIQRGTEYPIFNVNRLYFDWAVFGVNTSGEYPALDLIGVVLGERPETWDNTQLTNIYLPKLAINQYNKIKVLLKVYVYREATLKTGSLDIPPEIDPDTGCDTLGVVGLLSRQSAWAWTDVTLPWAT